MVNNPFVINIGLTGKTDYRINFFGKVILRVEEQLVYRNRCPGVGLDKPFKTIWRDANKNDLKIQLKEK